MRPIDIGSSSSNSTPKEDHPFSIHITKVKWEALKKQPRNNNPLEERYDAAPFRTAYSHHLLAGLLQVVGVPASGPCRACEKDQGRWATCVISYDHSSIDIAKGACANCLYTSAGAYCSFRESLPQDTADTDTNAELQDLEGKGFLCTLQPRMLSNKLNNTMDIKSSKFQATYNQRNPCTRSFVASDATTSLQVASKLTIPAFGPSGLILSTALGWFSDQTVHTVTMPWTNYTTPKPNWRCDVCEQDFDYNEKDAHICLGPTGTCYKCCVRFPKSKLAAHRKQCTK
ncbi:hypothetical protein F5Y12DRAFT_710498 [Xylaria sp. FL1777]|nr:hypothetical protein F5Y12DRAFT_710498 [Xylaria sp. FL1777]